MSSAYFLKYVCACGGPATPVKNRDGWTVQLHGGYGGSDYGRLLISRDGRRVVLEPPETGFKSSTRYLLGHYGVAYE